jgi:hypothetical protein
MAICRQFVAMTALLPGNGELQIGAALWSPGLAWPLVNRRHPRVSGGACAAGWRCGRFSGRDRARAGLMLSDLSGL